MLMINLECGSKQAVLVTESFDLQADSHSRLKTLTFFQN